MQKAIALIILTAVLLCACSGEKGPSGPISLVDATDGSASGLNAAGITKPDINLMPGQATAWKDAQEGRSVLARVMNAIGPDAAGYSVLVELYGAAANAGAAEGAETGKIIDGLLESLRFENIIYNERTEYELTCSLAETRLDSLGCAVLDLNGDGVPEMIFISGDYIINAIYALSGGDPALVGGYWSRNGCAVDKAGTLYITADNGAHDYYYAKYAFISAGAELKLTEMIGSESRDGVTGEYLPEPRYYRVLGGNREIIGDEEAKTLLSGFPAVHSGEPTKNAGLKFIPLK